MQLQLCYIIVLIVISIILCNFKLMWTIVSVLSYDEWYNTCSPHTGSASAWSLFLTNECGYCNTIIYVGNMQDCMVMMTPLVGREATPLPASPSTWPSQEPNTTTTPLLFFFNLDNTSFFVQVSTQEHVSASHHAWVTVHVAKVR